MPLVVNGKKDYLGRLMGWKMSPGWATAKKHATYTPVKNPPTLPPQDSPLAITKSSGGNLVGMDTVALGGEGEGIVP